MPTTSSTCSLLQNPFRKQLTPSGDASMKFKCVPSTRGYALPHLRSDDHFVVLLDGKGAGAAWRITNEEIEEAPARESTARLGQCPGRIFAKGEVGRMKSLTETKADEDTFDENASRCADLQVGFIEHIRSCFGGSGCVVLRTSCPTRSGPRGCLPC
jgi:hypothetical protein